jgi:adenine-specific DNA-methyltransferase
MSEQKNKILGHSMDIPADKKAQLKVLFPTVFTETKNDKGELIESVDFEKLKAELGTFTELFDSRRERYGMDWPGKKDALRLIQTPSYATLKPCREESVNFDTTENLYIEGDNLEVLKLLQKSYYSKVKMIIIDPPYNTGNEFIYPDNFSENIETYLEFAGLSNKNGKKFATNSVNEGRFHTKWLNMIYPRLYLARNLLKDDGVIFISIDDNEVNNLRKLCDEIFGEENFVANVIWKRKRGRDNSAKWFSKSHEYLLIYSKMKEYFETNYLELEEETKEAYKNPDNDSRGNYRMLAVWARGTQGGVEYEFKNKNGQIFSKRQWLFSKENLNKLDNEDKLIIKGDNIYRKLFIYENKGKIPETIWDDVSNAANASDEIKKIFSSIIFDTPKPVPYISEMLKIATAANSNHDNNPDIVLDFFSGSGTTAHAIFDLNKLDTGNRKFILVQLPEPCPEESEAFKNGFNTIAEIGKERIRRVINKINSEIEVETKNEKKKAPDLFSTNTELPIKPTPLDLGFKVLKLDKSNFKQWEKLEANTSVEKIEGELFKYVNHINPGATQEDLLYEILLKAGFQPTEKVEVLEFKNGKLTNEISKATDKKTKPAIRLFSVADGGLLLCLEDTITKEVIEAVVELPTLQQFICLDSAFHGNDQLKANAVQTFAARNMQKEKVEHIIFKTV